MGTLKEQLKKHPEGDIYAIVSGHLEARLHAWAHGYDLDKIKEVHEELTEVMAEYREKQCKK